MNDHLTTYTAEATIFYQTETFDSLDDHEAYGIYKVNAGNDEEAIAKFKDILSDNRIFSEAEEISDIGRCFNIQGHFKVFRYDGIPDYDEQDKFMITEGEDFEHFLKG